jgi:hypothetical protein
VHGKELSSPRLPSGASRVAAACATFSS